MEKLAARERLCCLARVSGKPAAIADDDAQADRATLVLFDVAGQCRGILFSRSENCPMAGKVFPNCRNIARAGYRLSNRAICVDFAAINSPANRNFCRTCRL